MRDVIAPPQAGECVISSFCANPADSLLPMSARQYSQSGRDGEAHRKQGQRRHSPASNDNARLAMDKSTHTRAPQPWHWHPGAPVRPQPTYTHFNPTESSHTQLQSPPPPRSRAGGM